MTFMKDIKMKLEYKIEGWVGFVRMYTTDGFIDKWTGDSSNDPNNKNISNIHFNSFQTYYRLNENGKWVNKDRFSPKRNLTAYITEVGELYSADEIWYTSIDKE